MIYFVLKL
uniref:Uncharacterized protein n=1 Tax=Rhizophora mucronata TaxID=61149 RepID=A0A2P2QXE9_RHIMU